MLDVLDVLFFRCYIQSQNKRTIIKIAKIFVFILIFIKTKVLKNVKLPGIHIEF